MRNMKMNIMNRNKDSVLASTGSFLFCKLQLKHIFSGFGNMNSSREHSDKGRV